MGSDASTARELSPDHPLVRRVRREVLPRIVEVWALTDVILFHPPDRPVDLAGQAPGILIVSRSFEGTPVAERVAVARAILAECFPVRPLCLTPAEFARAASVPGPVLAAARIGLRLLDCS